MDAKCDPLMTLMMGTEFRLLRTAKRAMRAEMTIVIVLALMTTWCVYALYRMVTNGIPSFETPQDTFSHIPQIPAKYDVAKINSNLYSDRQTSPSSRIINHIQHEKQQQQIKGNLPLANNISAYSLDYNTSSDYDQTTPSGADKQSSLDNLKLSPHLAMKTAFQDEHSSLLQHQAMMRNNKNNNNINNPYDDGRQRQPLPSTNRVHYSNVNNDNIISNSNSSNSSATAGTTTTTSETNNAGNNTTNGIGVAKIDAKDNEQIVKKIDSKLNIIPVASFTTKEEPEDVDYRINLDDFAYDDSNGPDERNSIPGIDSTNSTGLEPEDLNEDENEDTDETNANENNNESNNKEDEDNSSNEEEPTGTNNGENQNSTTSHSNESTKELDNDEDTTKLDDQEIAFKSNTTSLSTKNKDSPERSNDTAKNYQLYNGRVTFDEPPPQQPQPSSVSETNTTDIADDDDERENESEPDRSSPSNHTSQNETTSNLSGDQSSGMDDLPMDENNPGRTTTITPGVSPVTGDRKKKPTFYMDGNIHKNTTNLKNQPARNGTDASDGDGPSHKGKVADKDSSLDSDGDSSDEDESETVTIMPKIPNYRFKRDTSRANHENSSPRLMAPYELGAMRRNGKSFKRRSQELENLKPESSDTHLSTHRTDTTRSPNSSSGSTMKSTKYDNKVNKNYTINNNATDDTDDKRELEKSDQSLQESTDIANVNTLNQLDGITHLPLHMDEGPNMSSNMMMKPPPPTESLISGLNDGKSHDNSVLSLDDGAVNDILADVMNSKLPTTSTMGSNSNMSSVDRDRDTAGDLHRENQLLDNLYNVDHGLLLYPSEMEEEKEKKKSHYKKKHSKYKKEHKHKMSKGYKKGGEKKKKHKKEEKKFLKEKGFKGAKKGKKVVKGKGGQGGKKGLKHYKDKGYKKKGFKNVYHKEEFGDSKKYFDEFRDKDFKKKWKKFDDKYDYKQMKKWQGKDVKKAKKYKDHGENYKKTGKSKWKKKLSKSSKKGEKHKSHGEKKKKKSYGF